MTAEVFQLSPDDPPPLKIPEKTITELREAYRRATDLAEGFRESCDAVAVAHRVNKAALRRYVRGLENDELKKLDDEAEDLMALIDGTPEPAK